MRSPEKKESEKMKEIQNAMSNFVRQNPLLSQIMPAVPVLVLLEPVILLINSIVYIDSYYVFAPVVHLLFLLGLFLCFAADGRMWIAIAFVLLTLVELIRLIGYFSFPTLVYLAVFGAVAAYFVLQFIQTDSGRRMVDQLGTMVGSSGGYGGAASAPRGGFCASCGAPVDPSGSFCPVCGTPYAPAPVPPMGGGVSGGAPVGGGAASALLGQTSSGLVCLIFAVLLTLKIFLDALVSMISLISNIPLIILCVGVWMIFSSAQKRNLQPKGFEVSRLAFRVQMIFNIILPALLILFVLWLMTQARGEGSVVGILFGIILVFAAMIALQVLFCRGMGQTMNSAIGVLHGMDDRVQVSLFCIVVIFIQAGLALVSAVAANSLGGLLDTFVDTLTSSMDYYSYFYGSSQEMDILQGFIDSYDQQRALVVIDGLANVAMLALGGVMLLQLQNVAAPRGSWGYSPDDSAPPMY